MLRAPRLRILALAAAAVVPWLSLPAQVPTPTPVQRAQPSALTNDDVVRMVQAGLGDGVVIARIRTSPNRFDTSVDALIRLRGARVSDAVMQAMTEASSAPAASTAAAAPDPNDPASPHDPGIYLLSRDSAGGRLVPVEPTAFSAARLSRGLLSSVTSGIVSAQRKVVVMSGRARTRTATPRPQFFFYFEQRPAGAAAMPYATQWMAYFGAASSASQFTLVRLEAKRDRRELVVAEEGAFFRSSSGTRGEDVVEFDLERIAAAAYRVTPRSDLQPGEYCFFYTAANTMGAAGGNLFDFGVDRAP